MQIGIYGAGGFAREVRWLLSTLEAYEAARFVGFIDDSGEITYPVFRDRFPDAKIVIAISDPKTKERLSGCGPFTALVSHKAEIGHIAIGEGSIICAGAIATVDIEIGKHVHVNLNCTIGHDAKIGDFSTLAPGVHISGNVHIGKRVYIGTGANIINGTKRTPLVIGDDCVIAAGACVTKSCETAAMYAGVPAVLKKRR